MTLEIFTSRAAAQQILRHRTFVFQEMSQRYTEASTYEEVGARRQDLKNRQNSIDDLSEEDINWFKEAQKDVWDRSYSLYKEAMERGIAKECARSLLPLSTQTKMYMKGSVRSWIHYLEVRCDEATQKEHRDVAMEAKKVFIEQFPTVSRALSWI
jgi:thymidylate synthase (FAD)